MDDFARRAERDRAERDRAERDRAERDRAEQDRATLLRRAATWTRLIPLRTADTAILCERCLAHSQAEHEHDQADQREQDAGDEDPNSDREQMWNGERESAVDGDARTCINIHKDEAVATIADLPIHRCLGSTGTRGPKGLRGRWLRLCDTSLTDGPESERVDLEVSDLIDRNSG
jgi:hypothetical protein